ncbi:FAD-dependent oxidoreductase [Rhodococcus phenolicus]|uniref:FAD-dependent oxidoreductase n=1 Tax=Rhodococcus phenolicus TaxID=263849 RepID=UPI0009EDFD5B|nr:FAD-dependent oxidoreductase [Rhodococcus phenolicus]
MSRNPDPRWDIRDGAHVDVVVVGMGAAGCAAALDAHDAGARVIVLEKTGVAEAGGNTRVSGGGWFHHDDPEQAANYLRALCGDRELPESIVQVWAHGTREVSAWMQALDVRVGPHGHYNATGAEYPELPGSECYGGLHCVEGVLGRGRLFDTFEKALRERGIEVRYETAADRLTTDPASGAVTGIVTATGEHIRASGGVVLATGGFEGDPTLVREHLGLHDVPVWGSTAATGDGLRMAQRVGADVWHMDNMMAVNGITEPGSRHGHFAMFVYSRGLIWVDGSGARFVDEFVPSGHGQALIDGRYVLHPHRPMWVVFDEKTRAAGPISGSADVLPVGWNVLMNEYRWSADNSTEIDAGWILRGDTLEELAAATGLPADRLGDTVAEYNAACAAGVDGRFGRSAATLVPLLEPPFYAYHSGPMLAWTNGGPRRDEHARVLDTDGAVIDGLYAAGTVSSTFSWAKDGGFHIADAIVFGRIAGEHAALRAR